MYKDRLNAKNNDGPPPDPNAVYKKMIEDRMAKMMEDILLGKKKNASSIPGTKSDDKPKEVSKNTLMMIKMLAVRREQKDRKAEKKREIAWKNAKKAQLNEELRLKQEAEYMMQLKAAEYQAELAAKSASSWFGGSDSDNKNGWW